VLLASVAAGCLESTPSKPAPSVCGTPVTYDAIQFETDAGPLAVILYNSSAPKTVDLMQDYVGEGYYENRGFYRIVPGHVIQITDPAGGATDDPRTVPLETSLAHQFSAGAVGIARSADPDSGGPEFFIMDFATSHLHGNYTVWGQVVDGLDVVHRIARGPAVNFRSLPSELAPAAPTDSMALKAATIQSTRMARITPNPGIYPMQVAMNARVGDLRHSLEWPNCLENGWTADLTWYIRGYNGTVAPDAGRVRIQVDGQELPVVGEPEFAGIYHVRWTVTPGTTHSVSMIQDGKTLATLQLTR